MDEVVKERHWEEERRQLHDKIHALQQEIDFLQIEKGALAKELTRTATILPDRTLTRVDLATSASADDDLASATSGLLQAQRLLRSFHRQAKGKVRMLCVSGEQSVVDCKCELVWIDPSQNTCVDVECVSN
eukprot:TRINITY_DN12034_c0_g1_i16.p1 TRINITY_DN12034_c0_g1~~TRINITY_DN12034_c0_g1_i16.p1  ORF type:complete len:131 (-),score=31.35 TRINITY_DN12034_c0_g1_i16:792-1184(-)